MSAANYANYSEIVIHRAVAIHLPFEICPDCPQPETDELFALVRQRVEPRSEMQRLDDLHRYGTCLVCGTAMTVVVMGDLADLYCPHCRSAN